MFIKFRPDNFTDLLRTPWAGTKIARKIKAGLHIDTPELIGESWEFSTCPELPSIDIDGIPFVKHLETDPEQWLSIPHRKTWGNNTPLLVKYIDSSYDLSLQLHPPVHEQGLPANMCGKWESWLILDHSEGAGIYLGLKEGVTKEQFINGIRSGEAVKDLLHFIPVSTGDIFTIPPCIVHALGAKVCVLEPQAVEPGKNAFSMRLHDWNRKYDSNGNTDPNGKPRQLHIDNALKYIDFDAPRGKRLEEKLIVPKTVMRKTENILLTKCKPMPWVHLIAIQGSGKCELSLPGELLAIMVVKGKVSFFVDGTFFVLNGGESGALSANTRSAFCQCDDATLYAICCLPMVFEETRPCVQ